MTVSEQIARLKLRPGVPSSDSELSEVEELSGLTLPAPFRELWSSVGGCIVGAKILIGRQAGQNVAEFWDAGAIVEKLKEDRLPRVLPFGEDAWGNWFFLDEGGAVRLADWNANGVELVSPTFEEFLNELVPSSP